MANGVWAHDEILQAMVTENWLDGGVTNGGSRVDVLIVVGSSSVRRVAIIIIIIIIIIINEG